MYLFNNSDDPPTAVEATIEPVTASDLKKLTKKDFVFNWKDFAATELWKLRIADSGIILGVMSLTYYPLEYRIEINLITSRSDNVGPNKQYDRIAGCLIAWACRLAVKLYGNLACVSLKPKTRLVRHYQEKYGMLDGGQQLYVDGRPLYNLIQTYIDHEP
ncbi:N-acetyltransferase [Dyadobacter sp. CY347]|uniref:N-acetyltransferase n=1 Tax=Dyadobacter sp. CY347 TaxID=2909336 RepID=UPI001F304E49|nr:N-acetyltransferase [Dyadobacter sp. CY347]MCF2491616.1 N-acetyltransferase [Dyadobacter sp. CY347]